MLSPPRPGIERSPAAYAEPSPDWWERPGPRPAPPPSRSGHRPEVARPSGKRAGEVAFFWILGLFPALIALAAVLGVLEFVIGDAVARQAQDEVVTFLQRG